VAGEHPDEILVNELFIGDHAKITQTCQSLGLHTKVTATLLASECHGLPHESQRMVTKCHSLEEAAI
jgi:hypothetical protein